MKLNIYKKENGKRVIEKTYEAETYDLLFGVLEDVADAIDLDSMQTGSDVEIVKMVGNLVLKSMSKVRELLLDIFPGISEEEIKRASIQEIARVLIDVATFTVLQLKEGLSSKNLTVR